MGLSPGQYSMQCWNSTQQPSQPNQAQMMYQCLRLIRELQKSFTNGEIAVPSIDQASFEHELEICILYKVGVPLFDDIARFLSDVARYFRLDYRKFVKQDVGITRYFSQDELDNLSILTELVPESVTEQSVAEDIRKATHFEGFRMNDSWRNNTNSSQRLSPFQVPRPVLQRLHCKKGEDLAREVRSITKALELKPTGNKTSFDIITRIAAGAIWLSFKAIDASKSEFDVLNNSGMVFELFSFVATTVTLGLGPWLLLRDSTNVILVVNDTANDLLPRNEWIENGERVLVPEMIPATAPDSSYVSCGLLMYRKSQTKGTSLGTYGSAFGVSFTYGNRNFSIGMECPNSLLGGRNSIEIHNQEDARKACQMAVKSHTTHGWCNDPQVDVKIADNWGNVNWGRALILQN